MLTLDSVPKVAVALLTGPVALYRNAITGPLAPAKKSTPEAVNRYHLQMRCL